MLTNLNLISLIFFLSKHFTVILMLLFDWLIDWLVVFFFFFWRINLGGLFDAKYIFI